MNKILIAITSNVSEKDQIEINKIYESFDNNGYIIELFEDNEEQIQIDNLPSLIDMVLSKEMYRNNVEHLVILSNIRPLLLGWYRCYNSLADDFILYINENEMSRKTHRKYLDFVDALSSFDAGEMKNEDLHGRIYLNSFSLSSRFGDFLFPGERFKYFHSLSEFPFQPESQKEGILKEYLYKGSEYTFIIKSYTEKQRITLTQPNRKPTIVINDELLSFLEANPDFMLHAFMNIYLQKANHDVKFQALKQLIKSFSSFNVEDQILFYNQVVSHMNHNQFSFQQQAYIFSIMVQLAGSKDVVLQDIMKLMLNDHQHIEYHYPLLINTRFYSNNKQLKDYPEVINDRMKVMDKIRDYYMNKITIANPQRKQKRIAIVVGQLLSTKHSPTLVTLTIAKYLKRDFPEYDISIFVDDFAYYSPDEVCFPFVYSSAPSTSCKAEHQRFIENLEIHIHYSSPSLSRMKRIQSDIQAVLDFQPDVIFTLGADFSLRNLFLSKQYPMIISGISPEISSFRYGDVYTSKHSEYHVDKQFHEYKIKEDRFYKRVTMGIDLPSPRSNYSRKTWHLSEDDFVVVTAGNRLDGDIDEGFLHILCKFLKDTSDAKWVLVGNGQHKLIRKHYPELLDQRKIINISYEQDLAALYRICDIYANPFCKGNGTIGRIAMNMYLPVITVKEPLDITDSVGYENAVTREEYYAELRKLYTDQDYRKNRGRLMHEKANERTPQKWARKMVDIFGIAQERFRQRS